MKDCSSRGRCRECARKHHTLLHSSANNAGIKEESSKGDLASAAPVSMAASLVANTSIKNKVGTRL